MHRFGKVLEQQQVRRRTHQLDVASQKSVQRLGQAAPDVVANEIAPRRAPSRCDRERRIHFPEIVGLKMPEGVFRMQLLAPGTEVSEQLLERLLGLSFVRCQPVLAPSDSTERPQEQQRFVRCASAAPLPHRELLECLQKALASHRHVRARGADLTHAVPFPVPRRPLAEGDRSIVSAVADTQPPSTVVELRGNDSRQSPLSQIDAIMPTRRRGCQTRYMAISRRRQIARRRICRPRPACRTRAPRR